MKNILLIGCGLLGSSLLRRIHKKKIEGDKKTPQGKFKIGNF